MKTTRQQRIGTSLETPAAAAALWATSPAIATAWIDMVSESARFMTEQLESNLETQKATLACRSPMEFMQVQSDYLGKAMAQYVAETMRFYQLGIAASQGVFADVGSGRRRDYDDIPL